MRQKGKRQKRKNGRNSGPQSNWFSKLTIENYYWKSLKEDEVPNRKDLTDLGVGRSSPYSRSKFGARYWYKESTGEMFKGNKKGICSLVKYFPNLDTTDTRKLQNDSQ